MIAGELPHRFDVRLVVPDQIGQAVEFHNFEAEEVKFADFEFIEDRAPKKTEGSDMQGAQGVVLENHRTIASLG